ncbi:MAG TPA: hypothetical protein VFQ85_09980 [Mycobacteriales bacterium]|jgi:hypothetical protein|nr:hypothetical protein [Mycobacteriales bacterium]
MTAADPSERCAVHPALPAADACPVCARPRCAADAAAAPGGGCLACQGRTGRPPAPPVDLRAAVGAACVAGLAAVPVGLVSSEYVGAGWVGLVVPAFAGIVVSIAAEAGARKARGTALRAVAAVYSVLAVAVGLRLPQAAASPFSPAGRVLALYAIAAAASVLWTAPPKRRKPAAPSSAS